MGNPWNPWTPRNRERWAALRPQYRRRLERAGITERTYTLGKPLQPARGHAHTPEKPHLYNPELHTTYRGRGKPTPVAGATLDRERIYRRVRNMLEEAYDTGQWYPRSDDHRKPTLADMEITVRHHVDIATPEVLQVMATCSLGEYQELAQEQGFRKNKRGKRLPTRTPGRLWVYDDDHDEWTNPFWYH